MKNKMNDTVNKRQDEAVAIAKSLPGVETVVTVKNEDVDDRSYLEKNRPEIVLFLHVTGLSLMSKDDAPTDEDQINLTPIQFERLEGMQGLRKTEKQPGQEDNLYLWQSGATLCFLRYEPNKEALTFPALPHASSVKIANTEKALENESE